MIRRTADVQKENGNGILKTRGRSTPVEAMADGPVAAMAVTHAGRPRANLKILRATFAGLGLPNTEHQSFSTDDATSKTR